MECLGGNGYVEADGEGTMARIYREMPLNSIWEGAANIMALDLLRVLRSAAPVFDAFCRSRLDAAADAFGLLSVGTDLDTIIERAWPQRDAQAMETR
jgi:putative acyl-CoA dehydrogenase